MRDFHALAITGIPGSGKTELARRLAMAFGFRTLQTGDIARRVDPEGLAQGKMADEEKFQVAFNMEYWKAPGLPDDPVILDGLPRSPGQLELLPDNTLIVGLTCRPDIAITRQVNRAREGDTEEIIRRRTYEQAVILGQDVADGWIYQTCGYGRVVNTSMKNPDEIEAGVVGYLRGDKREIF